MSKQLLLAVSFLIITISVFAQPDWLWMQRINGPGENSINCIKTDAQNRIYLTGKYSGTISIGADTLTSVGGYDGFLAQMDTNGNWLWAISFGGLGNESASRLDTDELGNLYLAGVFTQDFTLGTIPLTNLGNYDIFIAKLSPEGQWLNAVCLGTPNLDAPYGFALSPDGSFYLSGAFSGELVIGETTLTTNNDNVFLSRWDSQFNPLWAQQLNNYGNYVNCRNVGIDDQGNGYLLGDFNYHCAFGVNNPLHLFSDHADAYVVKFDPTGAFLWVERVGDGATAMTSSFVDRSGNSYLSTDMLMFPTQSEAPRHLVAIPKCAKLNADGIWDWYDEPGELSGCLVTKPTADSEGNCFLLGQLIEDVTFDDFNLTGSFSDWNVFLTMANPDGEWQWGLQTYDSGPMFYTIVSIVTPVEPGFCVIAGYSSADSLRFGDFLVEPTPAASAFIIKAGQDPTGSVDNEIPATKKTFTVYPNPSSGAVSLEFVSDKEQFATVSIYNVKGQLVKRFDPQNVRKGANTLIWDGLSAQGKTPAPGIYIARLKAQRTASSRLFIRN